MRWIVPGLAMVLLAAAPASGSGTGIGGRVVAGPTCPVQQYPPAPGCGPRGLRARVTVRRASDRRVVKTLLTRPDGRFAVALRRGRYLIGARPVSGGRFPVCPSPEPVRVKPGQMTRVTIDCDSGIR